jgi:hypothetical protein
LHAAGSHDADISQSYNIQDHAKHTAVSNIDALLACVCMEGVSAVTYVAMLTGEGAVSLSTLMLCRLLSCTGAA